MDYAWKVFGKRIALRRSSLRQPSPRNCPGAPINLQKNSVPHSISPGKGSEPFPLSLWFAAHRARSFPRTTARGLAARTHQHDARTQTRVTDVWPGPTQPACAGARGSGRHGRPPSRRRGQELCAGRGGGEDSSAKATGPVCRSRARRAWRENGGENYTHPASLASWVDPDPPAI